MTEQRERFWMIYDWRTKSARLVKTAPRPHIGTVAVRIDLTVEIPDVEVPSLELKYSVPAAHVHALGMSEAIEAQLVGPDGEQVDERT